MNPKENIDRVTKNGVIKELKRQISTCCSSIMSVLLKIVADDRVPKILILLQLRVNTKMIFDTILQQNIRTSMAYQPRSISALKTCGVSTASISPSSPSAYPPIVYKTDLKLVVLFFPSSSFMKSSVAMTTSTMTVKRAMKVFRTYLNFPNFYGNC